MRWRRRDLDGDSLRDVDEGFSVGVEMWIWEHEDLVHDERLPKVGLCLLW